MSIVVLAGALTSAFPEPALSIASISPSAQRLLVIGVKPLTVDKAFVGSLSGVHDYDALLKDESLKLLAGHGKSIRSLYRARQNKQSSNQESREYRLKFNRMTRRPFAMEFYTSINAVDTLGQNAECILLFESLSAGQRFIDV